MEVLNRAIAQRKLLRKLYIYTLSPSFERVMALATAPRLKRESYGRPMVLSSLLAGGMVCEGLVGDG